MIRRNHFGTQTVCCDFCSDFLDTNETSFKDAWLDAKKDGWKLIKSEDSWMHKCPSCQLLGKKLGVMNVENF